MPAKKSAANASKPTAPADLYPRKELTTMQRIQADRVTGADHEVVVSVDGQPSAATIKKVAALPNLQFLLAPGLTKFPVEWCALPRLQVLYLGGAPLKSVPPEIKGLAQLRELDLGSCKEITALPEELGELPNLTSLDVRFTNLTALPKGLINATALKSVAIHGTSMTPAAIKKIAPKARIQK